MTILALTATQIVLSLYLPEPYHSFLVFTAGASFSGLFYNVIGDTK